MNRKGLSKVLFLVLLLTLLLVASVWANGQKELTQSGSKVQVKEMKFSTDAKGFVEPGWPETVPDANLVYWTWTTNAEEWGRKFTEKYPNVSIEILNVGQGDGHYTKLLTAIEAGSGAPDLAMVEFHYLPQFIETGALADMMPYNGALEPMFPKWVWSQCTAGGKLYGIAQDVGVMGLFYREDLFQKYGVALPTTWDEFADAAVKMHKADPNLPMTTFTLTDPAWLQGTMWQAGVLPFHNTSKGWIVDFTTPEAKKYLEYWYAMNQKGVVDLNPMWTPEWISMLSKGNLATIIGAAWTPAYMIAPFVDDPSQHWKVMPMPAWDKKHPTCANWGGTTTSVMADSKNVEVASLFAAWIYCSKVGIEQGASSHAMGGGGYFPAAVNYAKTEAFTKGDPILGGQAPYPMFEEQGKLVDNSFEWSPWTSFVNNEITVQFTKYFEDKQSVDETLENLDKNIKNFAKMQGFEIAD
jgi:multiple sugar transport system substrate-binding protein